MIEILAIVWAVGATVLRVGVLAQAHGGDDEVSKENE